MITVAIIFTTAQMIAHRKYATLTFINMVRISHANSHFRPCAILILPIVVEMIVSGMRTTIVTYRILLFCFTVSPLLPEESRPDLTVLLAVVARTVQSRCTIDKLLEEWWHNPTSRPLKISLKNKNIKITFLNPVIKYLCNICLKSYLI